MKRIILITSLLLLCALPLALAGASRPASGVADPCCEVISVDQVNGVVTAKDLKTGKTFQFEVDSRSLLKGLRVGQKVWKDAGGRKVAVLEGEPCCAIVGTGDGSLGGRTAITAANDTPGVTVVDGNTLILKKGYTFSVDAKKKSFNTKYLDPFVTHLWGEDKATCSCIGGKAESCKFYVDGPNSLYVCESLGDCECSITVTKGGTDKAQDEAPGARSSDATASKPAAGTGAAKDTPVGGGESTGGGSSAQDGRWEVTPNPGLKGAMGRIVIRTPERSVYDLTIFKAGATESSAYGYIGTEFLLLPGTYDVRMGSNNSEWRVRGVPVRRGMDTRLRAGQINLNLPSTSWVIYDETKKTWVHQGYAEWKIGLPVGKYYVKVNNDFAEVVIRDGQVTEF